LDGDKYLWLYIGFNGICWGYLMEYPVVIEHGKLKKLYELDVHGQIT